MKGLRWNHDRENPNTQKKLKLTLYEGGMGTFSEQMGTPGSLLDSDVNNARAGLKGTILLSLFLKTRSHW